MLRFRTAINGSIGPPAHVTVPLYATPAAAAFAKKSRRSASRQANSTTASPAANTAAQFHLRLPSLPFLPACLPESLLHRRLGSSLFFFLFFIYSARSANPIDPSSTPFAQTSHAFATSPQPAKLAPRIVPRLPVAGILVSTNASSSSCFCRYFSLGTRRNLGLGQSRRWLLFSTALLRPPLALLPSVRGIEGGTMAPKQATLGYVKSGQATLGWVMLPAARGLS